MTSRLLELRKFVIPEIIFGAGARLEAGRYARMYQARKALLVTDPGVQAAGWAGEVRRSLAARDIAVTEFSDVRPNPGDDQVMSGAAVYGMEHCDVIVAVGGGSVIDCAKGIGIIASCGGHITEYEGVDRVHSPMPPLICVPTTSGSAADISQFAIITNTRQRYKMAIISKSLVPDVALTDPETLITKDPVLTAATGLDVLSHAVEAYVSNAASAITDSHALDAVRLVFSSLPQTVSDLENVESRARMALASLNAGMAFSNASLGLVHAMAHSLGGYRDLPHGLCNAVLLPEVIRFNHPEIPGRFRDIAIAARLLPGEAGKGGDCAGQDTVSDAEVLDILIQGVQKLNQAVGINYALSGMGVEMTDIPLLAERALKDPCLATNPRKAERRDIEAICEAAF